MLKFLIFVEKKNTVEVGRENKIIGVEMYIVYDNRSRDRHRLSE